MYAKFKCAFDSEQASELNKKMFAAIYYAACKTSGEISETES